MPEAPLPPSPPLPIPLALPIEGMTCASCAGRVERALLAVPGITAATVNLASERAELHGSVPVATLAEAVRRAGYAVPEARFDLGISGMTCASCAGRVERALLAVPGVLSASVNLASEHAEVRTVAGVEEAALVAAVQAAGYGVVEATEQGQEAEAARGARQRRDLLLAALLTAPFLIGMLGMPFGQDWMLPAWRAVRAGHAGAVLARRALLPGRLGGAARPHRQYGPAGGARHHGGLGAVGLDCC